MVTTVLIDARSQGKYSGSTGANVFLKQKKMNSTHLFPTLFLTALPEDQLSKLQNQKKLKLLREKIAPEEMKDFVGCFLTGTAAEITPVSQISKHNFKVCSLIKDLSESYQQLVRKNLRLKFFFAIIKIDQAKNLKNLI